VPSLKQWRAGQRWARCDVAILATGSPVSHPELQKLPPTMAALRESMVADPLGYETCVSSKTDDPENDERAVWADCRDAGSWRLVSRHRYPGNPAHYPGEEKLGWVALPLCMRDSAEADARWKRARAYWPSPERWAAGDREIVCWTLTGGEKISSR
jgi:hypothetical protein